MPPGARPRGQRRRRAQFRDALEPAAGADHLAASSSLPLQYSTMSQPAARAAAARAARLPDSASIDRSSVISRPEKPISLRISRHQLRRERRRRRRRHRPGRGNARSSPSAGRRVRRNGAKSRAISVGAVFVDAGQGKVAVGPRRAMAGDMLHHRQAAAGQQALRRWRGPCAATVSGSVAVAAVLQEMMGLRARRHRRIGMQSVSMPTARSSAAISAARRIHRPLGLRPGGGDLGERRRPFAPMRRRAAAAPARPPDRPGSAHSRPSAARISAVRRQLRRGLDVAGEEDGAEGIGFAQEGGSRGVSGGPRRRGWRRRPWRKSLVAVAQARPNLGRPLPHVKLGRKRRSSRRARTAGRFPLGLDAR